jgi:hypothetical protein
LRVPTSVACQENSNTGGERNNALLQSHLVSQSLAENAKRGDNIKTGLKVTSYALNPSRSEQEHVAG